MSMKLPDRRGALMLLSAVAEPGDPDLESLIVRLGAVDAVAALWRGMVPARLKAYTAEKVATIGDPAAHAEQLGSKPQRAARGYSSPAMRTGPTRSAYPHTRP